VRRIVHDARQKDPLRCQSGHIAHGGLQTGPSKTRTGPMRVLMQGHRCKKRRETASNRDPDSVRTGRPHSLRAEHKEENGIPPENLFNWLERHHGAMGRLLSWPSGGRGPAMGQLWDTIIWQELRHFTCRLCGVCSPIIGSGSFCLSSPPPVTAGYNSTSGPGSPLESSSGQIDLCFVCGWCHEQQHI
jgi:hypothetical protein